MPTGISGWGGDTLTVTFNTPLPDDTYNVTLDHTLVTDLSGNQLSGNQANGDELRHFTIDTQPPPDTTPPTVTGYSLATDTGAGATDQITSDAAPQLTFTFSEPVTGTDAAVAVTNSSGASVAASSVSGWGTDTLTVSFDTTLPDDAYNVTLDHSLVTDLSSNPLSGNQTNGDELEHFTIDTQAPAAPSVGLVHDTGLSSMDKITSNPALTGDRHGNERPGRVQRQQRRLVLDLQGADQRWGGIGAGPRDGRGGQRQPGHDVHLHLGHHGPGGPDRGATSDTGLSSTDKITSNPALTVTGTETNALVEYNVNSGGWSSTYTPGTDGSKSCSSARRTWRAT